MRFVHRVKAFFGWKVDAPLAQEDQPAPSPVEQNLAWMPTSEVLTPLDLAPPACPALGPATGQLHSRYRAYIAQVEALDTPVADPAMRDAGQRLASDLLSKAIDLGSSKAQEFSPDIYWLIQSAALASLFADGPQSAEFADYRRHVHHYKDAALTTAQVWAFDLYVTSRSPVDTAGNDAFLARALSAPRTPNEPVPERADIDELLLYRPRLYPGGVAIKTHEFRENTYWPDYYQVVADFYTLLAKECWGDVEYIRHGAQIMLQSPSFIAQSSLADIQSLLTYCVRGERFCDGHWGVMIEKGHVLNILNRLAALREHQQPVASASTRAMPMNGSEVQSRSADGQFCVEVTPWEARNTLWVCPPRIIDTRQGECIFQFADSCWSADQSTWLNNTTVALWLRKFPGDRTGHGIRVAIDCARLVACLDGAEDVTLSILESTLEATLNATDSDASG